MHFLLLFFYMFHASLCDSSHCYHIFTCAREAVNLWMRSHVVILKIRVLAEDLLVSQRVELFPFLAGVCNFVKNKLD